MSRMKKRNIVFILKFNICQIHARALLIIRKITCAHLWEISCHCVSDITFYITLHTVSSWYVYLLCGPMWTYHIKH